MKRFFRDVLWAVVLLGTTSCFDPQAAAPANSSSSSTQAVSPVVFTGALDATNTVTGVNIRWAGVGENAKSYRVYRVAGEKKVLLATLGPSATSYIDGTVFWGQIYNYKVRLVDQNDLEDANNKIVTSLSWGGIADVTALSRNSLQITLAATAAVVDEVRIYIQPVDGGTKSMVGTMTGSDLTFTINDLRVGSRYKVSAQAFVRSLGKEDGNTLVFTSNTKTEGFDDDGLQPLGYQNVVTVRAFGDSPGAPVSPTDPNRTPQTRQVEITWNPFYNHVDSQTEYVLVRSLEGQALDTSVTAACTNSTDTSCRVCRVAMNPNGVFPTCKDDKIKASPARYQYAIALVQKNDTGSEEWIEPLPSNPEPFILTVPIPPANMVLVQRDAVNHEICSTMSSPSDPIHHNRCSYSGIGAVPYSTGPNKPPLTFDSGFYDFGYNLFVDRFEAACNWTSQASGGLCDPASPAGSPQPGSCIGTAAPTSNQGAIGQVYWKITDSPACYLKTSVGWVDSSSTSPNSIASVPSDPNLKNLMTNDPSVPFRPPYRNSTTRVADLLCSKQVDGAYGPKRLPRMREKTAFLAWPTDAGDPYALTIADMTAIEHSSAAKPSRCNSTTGASAPFPSPVPANVNDLLTPGNQGASINTSSFKILYIGSAATADCQSRYGVQDGIGNVAEWANDTLMSYSSQTYTAGISFFDNGNRDLMSNGAGIKMDGIFGSGGSALTLGTWYGFSDATRVQTIAVPLGLPLATTSSVYTPRTSAKLYLNGDSFSLFPTSPSSTNTPYAYGFMYGGTTDGNSVGRWFFKSVTAPGDNSSYIGFRCVLPAE